MGAPAHLQPLHGEVGVPDAAAEQGHVGHHRLHEAVVRAPEDLAVRGLVHPPAGVALGVNLGSAPEPLHQKQGFSHEDGGDKLLRVKAHVHLREGNQPVGEVLHVRKALQGVFRPGEPKGPHAFQGFIQTVAVHHPDPGPAAADDVIPAHHVHAAAYPQGLVKEPDVFRVVIR